jgi:Domain of unknown function (DUF4333)
MMRKVRAVAALGCALVCLSACGVSVGHHPTLSGPSVAHEIGSKLAKLYNIEAPTVSCPDGVSSSKGTTFVCTTVIDKQHLDLDGTVTGSNGQYLVVPRDAIIPIPVLVDFLTSSIKKKANVKEVTVDCGDRQFAVVAVGATITCSATFPGSPGRHTVTTTVLDKKGHVNYALSA